MARHTRQTADTMKPQETYFQKHKTAIITGSVLAAVVVAFALYVKFGKKGAKAPGARLRYYYF